MTARHTTTLLVITSTRSWVVGGLILGMKPRNYFQVVKNCIKLHIKSHQNMSDSWDKPLPGHATMSQNSFCGELGNKKVCVPTGVFTCKERCPDSSLKPPWDTPCGLYMKGRGHPAMVELPCTSPRLALSLEKMALEKRLEINTSHFQVLLWRCCTRPPTPGLFLPISQCCLHPK